MHRARRGSVAECAPSPAPTAAACCSSRTASACHAVPASATSARPREFVLAPPETRCANAMIAECNWIADGDGGLCACCELTRTRPNDSDETGLAAFALAEAAKRRLRLPARRPGAADLDPDEQIPTTAWRSTCSPATTGPVTTGHADGVITIDLAEGDDGHREPCGSAWTSPTGPCSATSGTRSATTTGSAWSRSAGAAGVPGPVRRRADRLRRRAAGGTTTTTRRRTGTRPRLGLRHRPSVGGLGRDLRALPAHPRRAADRRRLRHRRAPARRWTHRRTRPRRWPRCRRTRTATSTS